jgi:hypothetical protein
LGKHSTQYRVALGNKFADEFAKKALEQQPQVPCTTETLARQAFDFASATCALAAQLLPRWQALPKFERDPLAAKAPAPRRTEDQQGEGPAPRSLHTWIFSSTQGRPIWRCSVCLTFARDLAHKEARSGEACPGKASKLVQVFENSASNGHILLASEMEGTVLFSCSRCMAYGAALPKRLLGPCEGSRGTSYEKFVASRIQRGIHPKTGIAMSQPYPIGLTSD